MSVQNVLQGVLSQKVVADGGGYAVKNDLVNIDSITASNLSIGTLDLSGGLSADLNLNGKQIINDNGTLTRLGNIDMNGKILSDSTATSSTGVTLGSNLDLKGKLIVDSGTEGSYAGYVTFGSDINMKGKVITNSVGSQPVQFGTDIGLNRHDIQEVTSFHIYSPSTQAGQIQIPNGQSSAAVTTAAAVGGKYYLPGSNDTIVDPLSHVTANSIVVVTPTSDIGSLRYWVTTETRLVRVNLHDPNPGPAIKFNYWIAKY